MLVSFLRALPQFLPFLITMFDNKGKSKSKNTTLLSLIVVVWVGTVYVGADIYTEMQVRAKANIALATEKALLAERVKRFDRIQKLNDAYVAEIKEYEKLHDTLNYELRELKGALASTKLQLAAALKKTVVKPPDVKRL